MAPGILIGELLGLALLLALAARVWTSSKLRTRRGRLAWTSVTIVLPALGFLTFLLAVEYRRGARLQTN